VENGPRKKIRGKKNKHMTADWVFKSKKNRHPTSLNAPQKAGRPPTDTKGRTRVPGLGGATPYHILRKMKGAKVCTPRKRTGQKKEVLKILRRINLGPLRAAPPKKKKGGERKRLAANQRSE